MNPPKRHACFNGQLLPSDEVSIAANDRGFLYGDSLFETIRVHAGQPFLGELHLKRLIAGAEVIGLKLPYSGEDLFDQTKKLIEQNREFDCVVRLMVSRGTGERGYGTTGLETPTTLITTHPLPDRQTKSITLVTTSARVAKEDPLAQIKSGNKLTSVLAKRLAKQSGADDGLILNSDGNVAETSSANIFWIQDGILRTPPQSDGVLPGTTRHLVIDLATALGQAPREQSISSDALKQAEAVFVTSAATGIRAVGQVDGAALPGHPLVKQLMAAYESELAKGTSRPS
jgi:aminodeoxychorismate lyase